MAMKRMFMRIRCSGLSLCRLTLLWWLAVAGFLVAEPSIALAQEKDVAKATEQLFEAVHANDFPAVQASVAAGADVNGSDRWGMTPMELAIDKGYFDIGHYLVAVRNFSRAKTSKRPTAAVSSASPFDAGPSNDVASGTPGRSSPLGPMSKPAGNSGSGPSASASSGLDIKPSAGRAGDRAMPTGVPNPFDPDAPALGSGAFSIGNIGKTAPGSFPGFATGSDPLTSESEGEGESDNGAGGAPADSEIQFQTSGTPPQNASPQNALPGSAEPSEFSNRVIGVGGVGGVGGESQ